MAGNLSDRSVRTKTKKGRYGDGNGLYLQVSKWGSKSWVLRYQLNGTSHEMGLGPYPLIGLSEARERITKYRRLKLDGIDPIAARQHQRMQERLDAAKAITFQECCDRYVRAHQADWGNEKHKYQWRATLDYANKTLGDLPVASIDTGLVLKVLEPIWRTKAETAKRLRGRIERVLDLAIAHEFRTGPNPARWRGHLDKLLSAKSKPVQHHPALPYADLPEFMAELRAQDGVAARALEFTILTACRTGEVLNGSWSEVDVKAKAWTIPAARMKAKKEHKVPLCHRALTILSELPRQDGNPFVFVGGAGKPLHSLAMLDLMKLLRPGVTVHGFRSSFRDWAAELTNTPREIAEKALAHIVGNETERSYQRGDLFEKRRRLMADWERFCAQKPSDKDNVVAIRRRKQR